MKKLTVLVCSAFFALPYNALAINLVATNNKSKWADTADAICTGFVILGVALVVVFGTKSIINTFKDKRNEV